MTTSQSTLEILLEAKDQASKVLDGVNKSAGGLGKTFSDVGKIASGFLAANVFAGAAEKVTSFFGDSVSAIKESIAVSAQLDAVLKSTGGAAGLTAEQVKSMGGEMEKLSLFEDEAIISSSNLLLTFTNIGKDVFPRAQQSVIDMSQALGQDLKSSSIQLGKALNDPVAGITALSRVGVSFTDTQKAMIEQMVDAGDVVGAQTLILAELEKEFGGSAKAASDAAGANEVYKDKMNDLKEQIGTQMLPVQELWMKAQITAVTFISSQVVPVIEKFIFILRDMVPALLAGAVTTDDFAAKFGKFGTTAHEVGLKVAEFILFIQAHWPEISAVINFGVDFVITKIEGMIQVIGSIIEIVTSVVNLVSALVHGDWSRAWSEMKDIAGALIDGFVGYVRMTFGNIPEIVMTEMAKVPGAILDGIGDLSSLLVSTGAGLANGLKNGIMDALRNFKIGISVGSVDLGPLGSTPGINKTIYPFSFLKDGLDYVPFDNFPAMLHKGERVVPASENKPGASGGVTVILQNPTIYGFDDFERKVNAAVANGKRRGMGYGFAS